MSRHRYPQRALAADDVKAAAGLAVSVGPLFVDDLSRTALYVFSVLAVLFGIFALRTAIRHTRVIELSGDGIRMLGVGARGFGWEELDGVQLRYYSTRRDREKGWMSLKLRGAGRRIVVESSILGFEEIARRTAEEAARRDVEIGPASRTNFEAMGIRIG